MCAKGGSRAMVSIWGEAVRISVWKHAQNRERKWTENVMDVAMGAARGPRGGDIERARVTLRDLCTTRLLHGVDLWQAKDHLNIYVGTRLARFPGHRVSFEKLRYWCTRKRLYNPLVLPSVPYS